MEREPSRNWGWKRVGRFAGGWLLILVGLVGCVIPILPGIPLILGGLALLAAEYDWAKRWMEQLKSRLQRLRPKR